MNNKCMQNCACILAPPMEQPPENLQRQAGGRTAANPGKIIQLDAYYQTAWKGLEKMRELLRCVWQDLPDDYRQNAFLKKCIDGDIAADTLAMLAVADDSTEGDELSPEVIQMWLGHRIRGMLTGIVGEASLLSRDHPLRAQVFRLVSRASHLMDTIETGNLTRSPDSAVPSA